MQPIICRLRPEDWAIAAIEFFNKPGISIPLSFSRAYNRGGEMVMCHLKVADWAISLNRVQQANLDRLAGELAVYLDIPTTPTISVTPMEVIIIFPLPFPELPVGERQLKDALAFLKSEGVSDEYFRLLGAIAQSIRMDETREREFLEAGFKAALALYRESNIAWMGEPGATDTDPNNPENWASYQEYLKRKPI